MTFLIYGVGSFFPPPPQAGRGTAQRAALIAHDHQPVIARFAAPGLARTAQHLAHAGAALVAREGLEPLGHRIETLDRIRQPVGRPYPILVVHVDRIGTGGALRDRPDLPALRRRIVAADAAGVPEADPEHALGVRPDAAGARAFARRVDHSDGTGVGVDLADIVAGERRKPHVAAWRRGDAIAARSGRTPRLDLAGRWIDAAVNAGLSGEPQDALLIEGGGVEIRVGEFPRQGEKLYLPRHRIDTRDRVLSALGDPRSTVRPDDHAVRSGTRPEGDLVVLAGLGIEPAKDALLLAAVPHRPVRGGRDVMRIVARRQLIKGRLRRERGSRARTHKNCDHWGEEPHSRLPHQVVSDLHLPLVGRGGGGGEPSGITVPLATPYTSTRLGIHPTPSPPAAEGTVGSSDQLSSIKPKHFAGAFLGVQPQKARLRKGVLQDQAVAPDLAKQARIGGQVTTCIVDDPAHDRNTIGAAVEGERWFVATFGRERRHAGSVYIWRIGNDEIVTRVTERAKQVALMECNARFEAMFRNVARRDF